MNPPRFRGNAIKKKKGWKWECLITPFGNNDVIIGNFESTNFFPTKNEALNDLKLFIKHGCDAYQEQFLGKITGECIDMKTNETFNWNKEKHN